jgi:hypothetical protein
MNRLLLIPLAASALLVAIALPTRVCAQDLESAKRSAKVQEDMRRLDLLMQIMPLLIRKEQFDKILPVYAKVRAQQRLVLEDEDKQILALEQEVAEAIKKAKEQNAYPNRELVKRCIRLVQALGLRRRMARTDLVMDFFKVIDETFDAGQKKTMTAIEWKEIEPTAELDGKSDAEKIKFFIRVIFLDPLAYDILIDLDKRARSGG